MAAALSLISGINSLQQIQRLLFPGHRPYGPQALDVPGKAGHVAFNLGLGWHFRAVAASAELSNGLEYHCDVARPSAACRSSALPATRAGRGNREGFARSQWYCPPTGARSPHACTLEARHSTVPWEDKAMPASRRTRACPPGRALSTFCRRALPNAPNGK